jgi:ornithine carbamoyltransferase
MKKDLLTVLDCSPAELSALIKRAGWFKTNRRAKSHPKPLGGRSVALIFQKPSTRTRVSFGVGISELGGNPLYFDPNTGQMGRGETTEDTAKTLSRFVSGIVIRTFGHSEVEDLAGWADVPVVNALTDLHHPCQALADMMTIREARGRLKGLVLTYVGDGNNVANSLIEACALAGMRMRVACPPGFEPDPGVLARARRAAEHPAEVMRSPSEAAEGADILYTDVWTSMGQEAEEKRRLRAFKDYQVNAELLKLAKPDAVVMHCMPAHRGMEISAEVADGPRSIMFDQAENRLHMQKAILEELVR